MLHSGSFTLLSSKRTFELNPSITVLVVWGMQVRTVKGMRGH